MKKIIILCTFLWFAITSFAQNEIMVSGNITDSKNLPLISVTILELDDNDRVVSNAFSDLNGDYVIRIKSVNNRIRFSYVGFETQTFKIDNTRKLNIRMKDNLTLTEVVVTAQKTTNTGGIKIPDREMTVAVSKINTKEFEGLSVTSIDEALQGRIAGLDILFNSGDPGAGSAMRIRGISTINNNAQPLIVINDVPFERTIDANFDFASATQDQFAELLMLNVNDIEEIVVLKDAASCAIYGSRGANGVIMIQTKSGQMGPTRVRYDFRYTQRTQPKGMSMLSGDDYTMMMKQAYFNKTYGTNETRPNIPELNYDPLFPGWENYNNNTDWVAAVTQLGLKQEHNVSVSGGGERANFFFSGGYLNEKGTVIGTNLNRYSVRSELNYMVSSRMRFRAEFSFTSTDNQRNYTDQLNDKASLLDIAYKKAPNVSIYAQDEFGNNTGIFYNIPSTSALLPSQRDLKNPVALAYLAKNSLNSYRVLPIIYLFYDFVQGNHYSLKYQGRISFDQNKTVEDKFLPAEVSNLQWDNQSVNLSTDISSGSLTVITHNELTGTSIFGKHTLRSYIALETQDNKSDGQTILSSQHPDKLLTDVASIAYLRNMTNSAGNSRSVSGKGQINYVFNQKYIFDFRCNLEGNTQFGPDQRWGFFPGISAKWMISDEKFMKSVSNWLTLFAFRPSWGVAGNAPGANYLYYSRYVPDGTGYMGNPNIYPGNIPLADLRWEKVKETNLGVDIEFLSGKFTGNFNLYRRMSSDLLQKDVAIPSSSGFTTLDRKNIGSIKNDGWEVEAAANRFIKTGKFTLDAYLNLNNNINVIVDMDPAILQSYNEPGSVIDNGKYLTRLQLHNSYGSIYGFRYKGVYEYSYENYSEGVRDNAPVAHDVNGNVIYDYYGNPKQMYYRYNNTHYAFKGGDAIYEDINHDGSIDENDIVYLGNCNPKINGGFGFTARYDAFTLKLSFNFRYGNKIINRARMEAENMYGNDNQTTTTNWRWRKEGDISQVPRAVYQEGYNWLGSDRYVEDGSFVRLNYTTFQYNVPSKIMKKMGAVSGNVFLTANNLFILTKYSGVDPEVGVGGFNVVEDKSKTPRSKDWLLGLSVNF